MPTPEEIEEVVPKLGRGAELRLALDDGSEVRGRLYGLFDGMLCLGEDGGEQVPLERIADLMVHMHYEETPEGSSPFG